MAANMFAYISDIPGDGTEVNHKDWIVIKGFGINVARTVEMSDLASNQRGHANTTFEKIEVTSQIGIASNKLAQSVANGTVRPEIKLVVCRSGESASEGLEEFSIWTLKHVIIDKYAITFDDEGIPEESWDLAYIEMEHEYKETDQKSGKLATKNVFKWNLREGKVG